MDPYDDYDPPVGMHEAIREGNVDRMTKILQDVGDDYHVLSHIYGEGIKDSQVLRDPTILTLATEYGQVDCVKKILLDLGRYYYAFGVEMETDNRETAAIPDDYFAALIIAFSKGYSEICHSLLEFRLFEVSGIADSYAEFVTAAKGSDFLAIETLLEDVEEKETFLKGWRGHNIMNLCLLYGCSSSCLQKMLNVGISVNGWDYNGLTPLMCAIIGRNLDCVQFLLNKGADPYAPHLKLFRIFLPDGTINYEESELESSSTRPASTRGNKKQFFGPCALMYSAAMGNIPILQLMLKAAPKDIAGTPAPDHDGQYSHYTKMDAPLSFAIAYAENIEVVTVILEHDAAARENVGPYPIQLAMERDNKELFELLLQKIPPLTWKPRDVNDVIGEALHLDIFYMTKICDLIAEKFFEIDRDTLLFAVDCDRLDVVKVIADLPGFHIDTRYPIIRWDDYFGATIFAFACLRGRLGLAREFLRMGADVNKVGSQGRTPVLGAVQRRDVECLKFLMEEANADLDIADLNDETVFSAALKGDGVCLEMLLKSKKLLLEDGMKLKLIHRYSMRVFDRYYYEEDDGNDDYDEIIPISYKSATVLMQFKLFDWGMLRFMDEKSLSSLIFGAVSSGLSPGIIMRKRRSLITPLILAFRRGNAPLVRYLFVNLYFFPSDYQYLLQFEGWRRVSLYGLIRRITHQPLSLQAWSVLHISENLVKSSSPSDQFDRHSKVDALPLPTCLKDLLKFKTKFSQLCVTQWNNLLGVGYLREKCAPSKGINEIIMNGVRVDRYTMEKCTDPKCVCQGCGQKVVPANKSEKKEGNVN